MNNLNSPHHSQSIRQNSRSRSLHSNNFNVSPCDPPNSQHIQSYNSGSCYDSHTYTANGGEQEQRNRLHPYVSLNNLNMINSSTSSKPDRFHANSYNLESKTRSLDDKLYIETRSMSDTLDSIETTIPGDSIIESPEIFATTPTLTNDYIQDSSTLESHSSRPSKTWSSSSRTKSEAAARNRRRNIGIRCDDNIDEIMMVPSDKPPFNIPPIPTPKV